MTHSQPSRNYTPHLPEDYDANISSILPYYSAFHQETINLIKSLPSSTKVWMDTGCGTGSLVNKAIKCTFRTLALLYHYAILKGHFVDIRLIKCPIVKYYCPILAGVRNVQLKKHLMNLKKTALRK